MIKLNDNAAKELLTLISKKEAPNMGLRLSVQKGGCAGMQYIMEISQLHDSDQVLEAPNGAKVYLDQESLTYLEGCEVYYEYGLTDSGFKIRNPNASRSCGCGTSFEAKGEEGSYDPANDCK